MFFLIFKILLILLIEFILIKFFCKNLVVFFFLVFVNFNFFIGRGF